MGQTERTPDWVPGLGGTHKQHFFIIKPWLRCKPKTMKECGECDASLMKCLLKKNDTSSYHVKLAYCEVSGTNRVLWQNVNGVKRSRMMSAEITSLGKEFGKVQSRNGIHGGFDLKEYKSCRLCV